MARPTPPSSSAYCSLPIRNRPTSSRRTAQARTRRSSSSSPAQIGQDRACAAGAARWAKSTMWSNFCGRAARASAGGRGTACARRRRPRWPGGGPSGSVQIQTSCQAGGIASSLTRRISSGSLTGCPSASHVGEAAPAPDPASGPAREQSERRSRAARAAGLLSLDRSSGRASARGTPMRRYPVCTSRVPADPGRSGSPLAIAGRDWVGILRWTDGYRSPTPLSWPASWPRACSSASSATCAIDTQSRRDRDAGRRARPGSSSSARTAGRGSARGRAARTPRWTRTATSPRRCRRSHGDGHGDRPDRPHGHLARRPGCRRRADRPPRLRRRRDRAAARRDPARPGDDARARGQARPRHRHLQRRHAARRRRQGRAWPRS